MRRAREGFAIGGALLLLAALAVLGLSLARIFMSGQEDFAREAMGAQALQSAKAGAQLARYQSESLGVCETSSVRFPGLEEYPATLICERHTTMEAGRPVEAHAWRIIACNAPRCPAAEPADGYVQRELRVLAKR